MLNIARVRQKRNRCGAMRRRTARAEPAFLRSAFGDVSDQAIWCAQLDSNQRPSAPENDAPSLEKRALMRVCARSAKSKSFWLIGSCPASSQVVRRIEN